MGTGVELSSCDREMRQAAPPLWREEAFAASPMYTTEYSFKPSASAMSATASNTPPILSISPISLAWSAVKMAAVSRTAWSVFIRPGAALEDRLDEVEPDAFNVVVVVREVPPVVLEGARGVDVVGYVVEVLLGPQHCDYPDAPTQLEGVAYILSAATAT
jgi:hypothetical protein